MRVVSQWLLQHTPAKCAGDQTSSPSGLTDWPFTMPHGTANVTAMADDFNATRAQPIPLDTDLLLRKRGHDHLCLRRLVGTFFHSRSAINDSTQPSVKQFRTRSTATDATMTYWGKKGIGQPLATFYQKRVFFTLYFNYLHPVCLLSIYLNFYKLSLDILLPITGLLKIE